MSRSKGIARYFSSVIMSYLIKPSFGLYRSFVQCFPCASDPAPFDHNIVYARDVI